MPSKYSWIKIRLHDVWPMLPWVGVVSTMIACVISLLAARGTRNHTSGVVQIWMYIGPISAFIALACALTYIAQRLPPFTRVRRNPVDKVNAMMRSVDFLKECYDPLMESIRNGSLVLKSPNCEYHIRQFITEYDRAAGVYKDRELLKLLSTFVIAGLWIVVIFASLYLSSYALDLDSCGKPDCAFGDKSCLPSGTAVEMAVESVYWSSVTFLTAGYGELSPRRNCPWARSLVILELVVFVILFLLGPAIVLVAVTEGFVLKKSEFEDVIRDELRNLGT